VQEAPFSRRAGSGGTAGQVTTIVTGGRVVTPDGIRSADVVIENGRIAAIGQPDVGRAGTVIDATRLLVLPGLIDLQINGGFGHDFTSDPETIWHVGARLPVSGVTAFLPTIISSSRDTIARARNAVASGPPPGYLGATPLGLHLEGPMLSPQRPGIHDPSSLQVPSLDLVENWSPEGHVRMVTLAPELVGSLAVIEALVDQGVIVSLGHSNATYAEAVEALRRGADFGTHLYNAMPAFGHRNPGLVGALLSSRSVTVGIIADGIHVDPGAVEVAWRAKGPNGLVLVTDAMAAMGMDHGSFDFGGIRVTVDDTGPRNTAGDLAGSTLTLDKAVRNLTLFTGCSASDAVTAATVNPARVLKDLERGRLEVGLRGDVTVVDSDFNVKTTIVGGEVAFSAMQFRQEGMRS
jgi:N-acetylglucosamine-6-phosphate deacetylase